MAKFEYQVIYQLSSRISHLSQQLNLEAQEGWEAISLTGSENVSVLMRRPGKGAVIEYKVLHQAVTRAAQLNQQIANELEEGWQLAFFSGDTHVTIILRRTSMSESTE